MAKKSVLFMLIFILIAGVFSPLGVLSASAGGDLSEDSYEAYLERNGKAALSVKAFSFLASDQTHLSETQGCAVESGAAYGSDSAVLYTGEGSRAVWTFDAPVSGMYRIAMEYFPVEGRGQEIRRQVLIDGAVPFEEARRLKFSRVWIDEGEIERDAVGNDLYPNQVQSPRWCTEYFDDDDGYYTQPYLFYFSAGAHTLAMDALEEPVVIRSFTFEETKELPSYAEALAAAQKQGFSAASDCFIKIQAEDTAAKSSAMLSAVSDRTDPAVEPSDGFLTRLNTLGGGRFSTSGMWVEYTVEAPRDGLYQLSFKVKQNTTRDHDAYRTVFVNGEIPFAEAVNFPFPYSSRYQNVVFGGEEGAYLIALNKGENTIRLEASLGEIADFCRELEKSLELLNGAYRKIVTITGTSPDSSRDYSIDTKMPDVIELFARQKEALEDISRRIKAAYGQSNSYTAVIDSLALQLKGMARNHYEIPANVSSLNSNLSTLGSTIESMKTTDITLDYLIASDAGSALPKAKAGFFRRLAFSAENLLNSFVQDYNSIGAAGEEDGIEVWMIGGREQAQVLKQVIDSEFSAKTGKAVNVKLVSAVKTLLQATLAGRGPDVAVGIPQTDAMNFAFRGATADLTRFDGFADVRGQFLESALGVLTYEGGVYGLPQTMDYPVLFYREDLLEELGVGVPETWDDIYALLPILAQNNMAFGLPLSSASDGTKDSLHSFGAMLVQRGGSYYTDDLSAATFSDELTIGVMRDWSELYTSFGLPLSFNFVNRFAAGSMPLAVHNYSSYQTLVLYAPHIADLWSWTVIPGTQKEDGHVDHSVPIAVSATVVMRQSENIELAWEFTKWWCSADVQTEFGIFIENLLGSAGRYFTANVEAMERIPWSGRLYAGLQEQREWTVAIPEIPGGYYTARYLDNAFRKIYANRTKDGSETREVMYEYDRIIDEELEYQRGALQRVSE